MDAKQRAQLNLSAVLKRLQEPGRQAAIATAMGVSDPTVSRLKTEHLAQLCELLAYCGLKIVAVETSCFPRDKITALLTFAKAHLDTIETADDLSGE